jgi:hypothetical protein
MFATNMLKEKTKSYVFVPNGSKDDKDVFLPITKKRMIDAAYRVEYGQEPLIFLEYGGPLLYGDSQCRLKLSHCRRSIASPIDTFIFPNDNDNKEMFQEDVKCMLRTARKFHDGYVSLFSNPNGNNFLMALHNFYKQFDIEKN